MIDYSKDYIFFKEPGVKGDLYKFSSDLDQIGISFDVEIQNGTHIEILSVPISIDRPKYGGLINVIRIRADVATDYHTIIKEFWIPVDCLKEINSESLN